MFFRYFLYIYIHFFTITNIFIYSDYYLSTLNFHFTYSFIYRINFNNKSFINAELLAIYLLNVISSFRALSLTWLVIYRLVLSSIQFEQFHLLHFSVQGLPCSHNKSHTLDELLDEPLDELLDELSNFLNNTSNLSSNFLLLLYPFSWPIYLLLYLQRFQTFITIIFVGITTLYTLKIKFYWFTIFAYFIKIIRYFLPNAFCYSCYY